MVLTLFPLGIWHYLVGGLIVGLGVAVIFLSTGIIAGASGVFTSTWSYLSGRKYFHQPEFVSGRVWRLIFSAGLIVGALLFTLLISKSQFVTQVQWWRLALGGLLIVFGTRLSRGCTSGHGICGLASFSLPSLLAVLTFMAVAIITAAVVSALGVFP